jgi:hypothetical protein
LVREGSESAIGNRQSAIGNGFSKFGTRFINVLAFKSIEPDQFMGVVSFTITAPFVIKVYDGDNHHTAFGGCENYTNLLPIVGSAFEGILGIGTAGGLAFAVVNASFFEYFFYFRLINVAAIHAATGMFGINKVAGVTVDNIFICSAAPDIVFFFGIIICILAGS